MHLSKTVSLGQVSVGGSTVHSGKVGNVIPW